MKAAFIERPGPPESIRYGEVAMPVIRHDRQVLVKVTAVTVNPIDTYIRSGAYPCAAPIIHNRPRPGGGSRRGGGRGYAVCAGPARLEQQPGLWWSTRYLRRIRQCGRRAALSAARRGQRAGSGGVGAFGADRLPGGDTRSRPQ